MIKALSATKSQRVLIHFSSQWLYNTLLSCNQDESDKASMAPHISSKALKSPSSVSFGLVGLSIYKIHS